MSGGDLIGELFDALAEEIADARRWHGSAWTDDWDKRLVAHWQELGGMLAAVELAGDLVVDEFKRANTRPGPRGIIATIDDPEAHP